MNYGHKLCIKKMFNFSTYLKPNARGKYGVKKSFSVIIPTYNRITDLRRCLDSIIRQDIPYSEYEIIVVNDGGSSEVKKCVEEVKPYLGESLHYLWQEKRGPAAARNRAIQQSRGEIIFFLNDDVVLEAGYFQAHLRAHSRQPGHAVRGNTRWHPDVLNSPFMQWIAQGVLFYYLIEDPMDIGYEYFHTLDLSVHRRWLDKEKFNESFKDASLEDTELGLRLIKKGLRLQFAPDAICYHYHHYNLGKHLEKTRITARNAPRVVQLHPELKERLVDSYLPKNRIQEILKTIKFLFFKNRETPSYWAYLTEKSMRENFAK